MAEKKKDIVWRMSKDIADRGYVGELLGHEAIYYIDKVETTLTTQQKKIEELEENVCRLNGVRLKYHTQLQNSHSSLTAYKDLVDNYGRHHKDCDVVKQVFKNTCCDCGFTKALQAIEDFEKGTQ